MPDCSNIGNMQDCGIYVDPGRDQKTVMKSSESQGLQEQERKYSSGNVRLWCGTVSVAAAEPVLP